MALLNEHISEVKKCPEPSKTAGICTVQESDALYFYEPNAKYIRSIRQIIRIENGSIMFKLE